jgi:tetratricopeptide (TPR) repeat protein
MVLRRLLAGTSALLLLLAATTPRLLPAQIPQTRLLYEEGGVFSDPKVTTVRLTGPNGQVPPDTTAAQSDDRIHFLYRPRGDWSFGDDARQALQRIVLQQNGTRISPDAVRLRREDGTATAARVAYPRAELNWLKPLAVAHNVDTSATLSLPDVYAAAYPDLRRPYNRGRALIDAGQPLRALDTLSTFYGEVRPRFEFVSAAKATLDTAATAAVTQVSDSFRTLREAVIASPNAETLERLKDFQPHIDTVRSRLGTYFERRPEAGAPTRRRLADLDTSATALYTNSYDTYRRTTIRVFFRKPYTRPKPALFIDVLTRLLLHPDPALAGSGIGVDSLSSDRLMGPRFADARQTLREERWWQDFQDVLAIVDNNLRRHDRLFAEEVLRSLRLQRTSAVQPYYEILAALDAAAAGNQAAFDENWTRALSTCTDLALLNTMQEWALARRTPPSEVPASVMALMEDAERLQNQQRTSDALRRLERASLQTSDYPPLFYALGRLKYAQGDTTLARTNFERARSLAPRYTAPRVATLRLLLAQDTAEVALQRADSTLQTEPYWLVYLPKARALGATGRPDEAVDVLRQRCEQLNDQSYALYVVLARLYARQQAWKGAVWAVRQAETFDPKRPAFLSRLQTVREKIRETDKVSLQQSAGSDPTSSGASGQ